MTVIAFATGGHVIGNTTALFILLVYKEKDYSSGCKRACMESSNWAGMVNRKAFEVPWHTPDLDMRPRGQHALHLVSRSRSECIFCSF